MESLLIAHRFLNAGWKELDTAFRVQSAVYKDMKASAEGTPQYKMLKSMFYQLEEIITIIMASTSNLNRWRSKELPLLPRVVWLPSSQYDDESGVPITPTQPDLPSFDTQEELYTHLKSLADTALEIDKSKF